MATLYFVLAAATLVLHFVWILWVVFGALLTRGRRVLSWIHVGSVLYGAVIEAGPWPCPLTLLEQRLLVKAGRASYEGSFLVHYLERLVYPDIQPEWLLWGAGAVCVANLAVYARRFRRTR